MRWLEGGKWGTMGRCEEAYRCRACAMSVDAEHGNVPAVREVAVHALLAHDDADRRGRRARVGREGLRTSVSAHISERESNTRGRRGAACSLGG